MPMGRVGAIDVASCTASLANASRSTRLRSSGRCASSWASSSRSSTSPAIRLDSPSIRDIAMSTSPPPCRYNSAKPRIVVNGVRNSWLASVMNRRIRSSDSRAFSADASDEAIARWICASIPLSARESWPTSVFGSLCGTRLSSWPAAIEAAVFSTSINGRRLRCTTQ